MQKNDYFCALNILGCTPGLFLPVFLTLYTLSISIVSGQEIIFKETFDHVGGPTEGGPGTYKFPDGWLLRNVDGRTPASEVDFVNEAWVRGENRFSTSDSIAYSTSWYEPVGQADDWMWTPPITLPATLNIRLSWRARAIDMSYRDGYEVRVMAAPTEPTGGTGVIGNQVSASDQVFAIEAENSSWTHRAALLNRFAGQTVRIAFRNNSVDQYMLMIDDVVVERVPGIVVTPDAEGTVYVNHLANGDGSSWDDAINTLSDALAAAQINTGIRTIKIAQGTYYPTGVQNSDDRAASFNINRGGLKLYGGYNAENGQRDITGFPTILSGNIGNAADSTDNSYHVMMISGLTSGADSVVVDGVTIRDGLANDGSNESLRRGGGLVIENCLNNWRVTVRNSVIMMNAATASGGGVWVRRSMPVLADCRVERNRCEGLDEGKGGGLVFIQTSGRISGSDFVSNTAKKGGGAIYNDGSELTIRESRFSGNTGDNGGGIFSEGWFPVLTISDCDFEENHARAEGGAMYNRYLAPGTEISNCEFSKNAANLKGGAMYNSNAEIAVTGCRLVENSSERGGAIYNKGSFINVESCEFNQNSSTAAGGALYSEGLTENSIVSNSIFRGNIANIAGGAFIVSSFVHFKNCEFTVNQSLDQTAALRVQGSSNPRIEACLFRGNKSATGVGALLINDCTSSLVENSVFSGNYSGTDASAMYVSNSGVQIVNSTFAANYAAGSGVVGGGTNSTVDLINSITLFNGSGGGVEGFTKDETSSFNWRYGVYHGIQHGEGVVDYRFYTPDAFKEVPDFNSAPTTDGDFRPTGIFWGFVDRGSNSLLPAGIATDIAGRRRIHNGSVDFGAYEYQGLPFHLSDIYVDKNSTGSGTGYSWADAAPGLEEALAIAEESSGALTIHVAGGTYYPTSGTDRDAAFVLPKRSIRLLGGYDPATGIRNPAANPSLLSGNIGDRGSRGDNSYHVLVIAGLGTDSTIVDGFTISHGNANGAGSFDYNAIEILRNRGGGILVTDPDNTANVVIRNCIVSGNEAAEYGGGVSNYNTSLAVINSLLHGNRAALGGGISNIPMPGRTISPSIIQSTIAGNRGDTRGGGVDNFENSSLDLSNTLIYWNNSGLGGGPTMTYTARYSLIQGRTGGGDGNLDGTVGGPQMFAGGYSSDLAPTTNGNYALSVNSPAVDKGSNAAASGIALDLAFRPRILEGQVDIGAYEFFCTKNTFPPGGTTVTVGITQGQLVQVGGRCEWLGALQSPAFSGYTGAVTVQSWLAGNVIQHGLTRYVPRYHAISAFPLVSSELIVTLYYANSDFKTYNLFYGDDHNARLPDIDDETPVTGNLRVVQYHGTGSGNNRPDTYPGPRTLLQPAQVTWDEALQLWKVAFRTVGFSGFFVTGQGDAALPVTLLSFKAEKQENTVMLTWRTIEEKDFSHFEVERSADARNWQTIGRVAARGDSYSFRDNLSIANSPLSTLIYYRLKMLDADGTFSYSPIASVTGDGSPGHLDPYPNPSPKGYVKLDANGLKIDAISVYDLSGRKMEVRARMTGNGCHELDFSGVASGIYTIVIFHEDGVVTRKQVVF